MFKQLIVAGLIVSVLLLACGPTASPESGDGSSKSADVEATPTSTPWPTKPASTPKPAQPTKPPLATPTPEPEYLPPPPTRADLTDARHSDYSALQMK